MQNKKTIFVSAFLVMLFVVIYLVVFNAQRNANKGVGNGDGEIATEEKLACTFGSADETYGKAIENKDVKICNCLEDEQKKEECLNSVRDMVSYDKILNEDNLEVCDGIKDAETKNACINIGQARQDYLNELAKEEEEANKSIIGDEQSVERSTTSDDAK